MPDALGYDASDLILAEWVPIDDKIKLESHRASMLLAKLMHRISLWILVGILAGAFAVAFMNITKEHNDFAFHVITTITGGLIGYLYPRAKGGGEN